MNKQEYQNLLSKFYQAETSAEEEKLLKNFENKSQEEKLFFESLQEEKTQKMNWDFEDFIAKTKENTSVVSISKHRSQNNTIKTSWYWMAASFLVMMSVGYFLIGENGAENSVSTELVTAPKLPSTQNTIIAAEEEPKVVSENIVSTTPKVKKAAPKTIISKKQPIQLARNTETKQEKVENNMVDEPLPIQDTEYESGFVMINGKKIENEEAAIHITQNAFKMFAGNVSAGVQQTEILKRIELEF